MSLGRYFNEPQWMPGNGQMLYNTITGGYSVTAFGYSLPLLLLSFVTPASSSFIIGDS